MKNSYADNWKFYQALTNKIDFDIKYYQDFVATGRSLELFAGFGRVSNHLADKLDYAVELEPGFLESMTLPKEKKICADVLTLDPKKIGQFDRIFAAYNSFCLFTEEKDIAKFFQILAALLKPDGKISLSYSQYQTWEKYEKDDWTITVDGKEYIVHADFELNHPNGKWIDIYKNDKASYRFEYPVHLYDDKAAVDAYANRYGLFVEKVVEHKNAHEPGWVDFVLTQMTPK